MAIEPFATVDDYQAAYGPIADTDRVSALLRRATGYLMGELVDYQRGTDDVLDLNLSTVCLSMVHRALSAPSGMEGVSQYSQTAGSYNASVTFANPTAELWLGKADMKRLGLAGARVFSIAPMAGGDGHA